MVSIRTKLMLALGLILVSGFFATSFFFYTESKKQIRTTILEQNLPLSRDNIYSEIQRDLARPIFVSSLMANDTFLKDWVIRGEKDGEQIRRYLTEIQGEYGFSSAFFVSDITRNYYHFKGLLKQVSFADRHDVWYYRFKAKGLDYELNVDANQASQNLLTIFINHRLKDYDGKFLGAVGVGLDFNRVAQLMDDYKNRYQRNVYMVDPSGLIQVHTDPNKIQSLSIFDIPGLAHIAESILNQKEAPAFYEYDDSQGRHILLTSRYIRELDWFLMVAQNETETLASLKKTLIKNSVISLIITLITLGFAFLVINYFQHQLEFMAMKDPLTRTFNRREFERRFRFMTEKIRRKQLTLILFDIDHLKTINDRQGHLVGDRVIKEVSAIASKAIRAGDMLVRWGGDEFIILVLADMDIACQVAERFRQAVQDSAPSFPDTPKVSVSCGIAAYEPGQSLDSLLKQADQAMYQAKASGRNTVRATPQWKKEDHENQEA